MTRRPLARTATVLVLTGWMLTSVGLVSATTASADRPADVQQRVYGPSVQMPLPALEHSIAPLRAPVLTVNDGRKFR